MARLHGRPAYFISRTNAPAGVNTWMRWFSRSATHRLPCGVDRRGRAPPGTCRARCPCRPTGARNLPSLSNFSTRASPLAPGVCPCDTNTSPLAAIATSVGWLSLRDAGGLVPLPRLALGAQRQQQLAGRSSLVDHVRTHVGGPDVALRVHLDAVRPREHAAAEGAHERAVRIELVERFLAARQHDQVAGARRTPPTPWPPSSTPAGSVNAVGATT